MMETSTVRHKVKKNVGRSMSKTKLNTEEKTNKNRHSNKSKSKGIVKKKSKEFKGKNYINSIPTDSSINTYSPLDSDKLEKEDYFTILLNKERKYERENRKEGNPQWAYQMPNNQDKIGSKKPNLNKTSKKYQTPKCNDLLKIDDEKKYGYVNTFLIKSKFYNNGDVDEEHILKKKKDKRLQKKLNYLIQSLQ